MMVPSKIPLLKNRTVLVAGDLMIDEYLWGEVERISPEAPVPVVNIQRENFTLGGSGNVVNNLAALGAEVLISGVVGDGENGRLLLRLIEEMGQNTSGIVKIPGRHTTRKTRVIAGNQHVVRIDRETRAQVTEEVYRKLMDFTERNISRSDVIIVSDYGKGCLTDDYLHELIRLSRKHGKTVIVDPKGRDFSRYSGASLITPNRKEAGLAANIDIETEEDLVRAGKTIMRGNSIENVLITLGKDGMVLFEGDRHPCFIPTSARQVFDVSGAGDTVVSVSGLALAAGFDFETSARLANIAAGVVVGKMGTATVSLEELSNAAASESDREVRKLKTLSDLAGIRDRLKKEGKRVVLTNGCFDILHVGHIHLFNESRNLGDVLIVAVDDDESVGVLKGAGRPVIALKDRIRILNAIDAIDHILVFGSGEIEEVIASLKPDILTKGNNYAPDGVEGKKILETYGGSVVLVPVTENVSATDIIRNIRNNG